MRKEILLLLSSVILIFTACSKDQVSPNDRFDTYMEHWNDENFTQMYDMLATDASNEYETEQFVDRYNKIYEDFNVDNLTVTYEKLAEEDVEEALKDGVATIPFSVNMDTIAGPINFNYEATLIQEEVDDEENWFVQWDPGFIFPEIKDGGELKIDSESPRRGEILDRNDMPLAINDTVYEIGMIPEKLGNNEDAIKKDIAKLLHMSVESIDEELNADWVEPDQFVPLKKVPKSKESTLDQLWELDSVTSRDVTGRVYPLGKAASHLVGYVGQITAEELEETEPGDYNSADEIGKRGLEQLYEEKLKGEKGVTITVSKEDEDDFVLAEKPVKDGDNISLTIDANIQEKIYDSFDKDTGTSAAIHPKTGETLALISSPGFDPNELLYGMSEDAWSELQDDPKSPMTNRFSATYAPGSVIKPITAAIGLNNGSIDPNEGLEINGLTWSNGKGWGDYEVRRVSSTDKPVDLADALLRSDNIYFAMQAVDMGTDSFINGLKLFGFEENFPYEYPYTTSTISQDGMLDGEVPLANTSYGQGQIEISSLHMALTYTPFLNDGNMIKPTLLKDEETKQVWQKDLISPEQAELMQDILRDVVKKGTAKKANKNDLDISGKTGTAELKQSSDEKGKENGWFIGYPTKDQDVLIAMMVENVGDKGASSYVAKKVADALVKLK